MINIVYDYNSDFVIFMSRPNTEESSKVGVLDELLQVVAEEIAIFASCVEGDAKETYTDMADALLDFGLKAEVNYFLDELIKRNEESIFLKDETVREGVRHMAYILKDSISEAEDHTFAMTSDDPDSGEFTVHFQEELKEQVINEFKKDMLNLFNENVDDIFEKNGFDDCIEDIF